MKRILSIILCIFVLLSFVGCKNGDPTATPSGQTGSSTVGSETLKPQVWFSKDGVELTQADLDKAVAQEYVKAKNIIVMISDGMGLNDLELAYKYSNFLFDYGLTFDKFPNIGDCITDDIDGYVTDSAASATALATGFKTRNSRVGRTEKGKDLKNAPELARENGKRVGIVTNDAVYGATPSAFTVHNLSRHNTEAICRSFVEFAPDVLIAGGYSTFGTAVSTSEKHRELIKNINVATSMELWEAKLNSDLKCEKPFFGFFNPDLEKEDYMLAQATETALKRLENENGFFLMVEGAACDKAGHNKNAQQKVTGVGVFDKAVAVAVKYCLENPDTILIITSDHETGGVTIPEGYHTLSDDVFTINNHTGTKVGVFALGYGTEYFKNKTVDNTDIGKFIHAAIKGETYK